MQKTINEDLKNTLNKVCERCDKIEKENNIKREEVKFEDDEPQELVVENN